MFYCLLKQLGQWNRSFSPDPVQGLLVAAGMGRLAAFNRSLVAGTILAAPVILILLGIRLGSVGHIAALMRMLSSLALLIAIGGGLILTLIA
jgi:hypothetical protein